MVTGEVVAGAAGRRGEVDGDGGWAEHRDRGLPGRAGGVEEALDPESHPG